MELKFDAVELDLRLLKDNAWVLHHDPLVGRVVRPDLGEANGQKIKSPEALTSSAWANAQVLDRFGNPTNTQCPPVSE